MPRAVLVACLLGLAGAMPLSAQEAPVPCRVVPFEPSDVQAVPVPGSVPASEPPAVTPEEVGPAEAPSWETVWGLIGVRVFFAGPKIAPNGAEYHPSFSVDTDINFWVCRKLGLYVFTDTRFWAERPEYGVTGGRDGGLGFSKRQFDLLGGGAWNYAGAWEARLYGYGLNNLNRGKDFIHPAGHDDGFVAENRYYLSPEYARLGRTGFDVARADFLSVAYYLTKNLVGNDGEEFKPGLQLRAYLTYDLWAWPAYAYGDVSFITERSLKPRLMLFDVGVAALPFHNCPRFSSWQNWEVRLGVENTGDFQQGNVQNLWYVSLRLVF
jgi:hypothetical protein